MSSGSQGRRRAITGFGIVLLIVFAFSVFASLEFKTVVVDGVSMEPTFHPGQRLLVSKAYWLVGPIRHKDVVVIRDDKDEGYIIKRVFRLAGERVPLDKAPRFHNVLEGEFVVPANTVYVLGDNLLNSEDSRDYGPVALHKIIGKVVIRP